MTTPRNPTYTIGGAPPYGWKGTADYNPFQAPSTADTGLEVALYERQDWRGGNDAFGEQAGYQNPPFAGIGSTSARVPSWMRGGPGHEAVIKRILRGYMRRTDVYTLAQAVTPQQKASNARLFFMYNPASIQRTYLTASSLADAINPTNDPSGPDQANTSFMQFTQVQFELLFDRQEEVSRYPNHPGCLIDLAVFDLLARGGSQGQATVDNGQIRDATDPTKPGDVITASAPASGAPDSSSLAIDISIQIAVIFSPNLVFYGNIIGADAYFEKFSHRMTPTRMRLVVTLKLRAVGPEAAATTHSGQVEAQAAAAAKALDPTQPVYTDADKDQKNADGRASAIKWAENWLPGRATPNGVPYHVETRCQVAANDNYVDVTGIHIPIGFDCSAYVARSYGVIGWLDALGLPQCADTNGFEKTVKDHGDVWDVYDIAARKSSARASGGSDSSVAQEINAWLRPGDLILRSGTGSAGHIMFCHDDNGGANDGSHSWTTLHSYHTGAPPKLASYTTQQFVDTYSKLLRAQPIKKSKKPKDAPTTTPTGNPADIPTDQPPPSNLQTPK